MIQAHNLVCAARKHFQAKDILAELIPLITNYTQK